MIRIDCRGVSTESPASSEQVRAAADCFVKHGYAILDHVVPAEKIQALHREFLERYDRFLRDEETDEVKKVGPSRYMISLRLDQAFGDTQIFANPCVVAVVRAVLEDTAILEAYGAVVSLPGASAQPNHYDGPHLFGAEISAMLPAHALTYALPLIEMNDLHGSTTLWPDSHRWRNDNDKSEGITPVIPIGSCVLWDFRLTHSGTTNKSPTPRPMVYCTYARPWYKDPVNFRKKMKMRRVDFDAALLETLPEDARRLLLHAAT
jgi:ectoine hydroxylase-related dioxygenase (phytanoyl-CoA dioxygenase family)